MTVYLPELLAFGVGGALGTFFFGGLLWTTRRLMTSGRPALLMSASFLLRVTVVVLGLYAVSASRWDRCVAGVLGLLVARTLVGRGLARAPRVAHAS